MTEETILQSKVPPAQADKSLLDYLCYRFRYQSREVWEELITRGKVTLNGASVSPSQILKPKDLVAYSVVLQEPPVDRNIQILHEEGSFLVASKPGSLPSHADGNFIKNTFIYILNEMLRSKGFTGEVRLAHRLDRETSGLMVAAKNKEAHLNLTRQFEKGLVEKEYLAVVRGEVAEDSFRAEGAIGRDQDSKISIRRKVVPDGTPFSQPALTLFERVQPLKNAALLRCFPKTGRTSQIRVHLDSLGHPLAGDKLYGRTDEEFLEYVRHVKSGGDPASLKNQEVSRQLLHAHKLSFAHPETGKALTFEAPLPEDMSRYLEKHRL